jgi:hypothetical protein
MTSDHEAEIRASVAAHADLGPGYDDAVAEGLVERIGAGIDKRIDARLGQGRLYRAPVRPGLRGHRTQRLPAVLLDLMPEPGQNRRVPRAPALGQRVHTGGV